MHSILHVASQQNNLVIVPVGGPFGELVQILWKMRCKYLRTLQLSAWCEITHDSYRVAEAVFCAVFHVTSRYVFDWIARLHKLLPRKIKSHIVITVVPPSTTWSQQQH